MFKMINMMTTQDQEIYLDYMAKFNEIGHQNPQRQNTDIEGIWQKCVLASYNG